MKSPALLLAAGAAALMAAVYSASASATLVDPSADGSTDAGGDTVGCEYDLSTLFNFDTSDMMIPNLRAFLDMIAVSEGTKGRGHDGYTATSAITATTRASRCPRATAVPTQRAATR